MALLETGGLAVVGSRHVDDDLIEYTMEVARLAARAGRTIVSGGAKAGFNVGNAMQRNQLIYALADVSLVVSSDLNKGGTWAGATEQLEKLRFAPVFVKSPSKGSQGLEALQRKGALPWPNPHDVDALDAVFDSTASASPPSEQSGLPLVEPDDRTEVPTPGDVAAEPPTSSITVREPSPQEPYTLEAESAADEVVPAPEPAAARTPEQTSDAGSQPQLTPAELLFDAVRNSARLVLTAPTKDADFAEALGVSSTQAKVWLKRLMEEGVIEKQRKPPGYIVKQSNLFE